MSVTRTSQTIFVHRAAADGGPVLATAGGTTQAGCSNVNVAATFFTASRAAFDGTVMINDGMAYPGSFVTCEITETHAYDLVARIV